MSGAAASRPRLVAWLLTDDKPGHRTQVDGLVRALARRAEVDTHWLPAPSPGASLLSLLRRRFAPGDGLPPPDLIICAGHRTHLAALAARRAHGGRVVVLMKPSLPLSWFDLCVIPQHDRPPARANVVATRGVLNTAQASQYQKPTQGLFLIGGPSKHHKWDEKTLLAQIRQVVKQTPEMHWALTTSRRTPPETEEALKGLRRIGVEVIPVADTDAGWVIDAITVSAQVWVTEDSVSMIYESLTAGAATGILWVPRQDLDRVTAGVDALVADGYATPFLAWKDNPVLAPPPAPLAEADRVADLLLARQD